MKNNISSYNKNKNIDYRYINKKEIYQKLYKLEK